VLILFYGNTPAAAQQGWAILIILMAMLINAENPFSLEKPDTREGPLLGVGFLADGVLMRCLPSPPHSW
jgi:hypothetical protein